VHLLDEMSKIGVGLSHFMHLRPLKKGVLASQFDTLLF
jgi:hypothetical protein